MATKDDAAPLSLPPNWIRGDTIGPIISTVTGRSVVGASSRLTFRKDGPDGQVVQVCASESADRVGDGASAIILDGDANTVTVEPFEPNTSGGLFYDWEIRWLDGNPRVVTLHMGTWKLKQDSSR